MSSPRASTQRTAEGRLAVARRLLAEQQGISATLGNAFSGNAMLELLLILYIAHERGERLATREVIAAVGSAPAVTWRWIQALLEDGLVTAAADRSEPMTLTPRGIERVKTTLDVVIAVS